MINYIKSSKEFITTLITVSFENLHSRYTIIMISMVCASAILQFTYNLIAVRQDLPVFFSSKDLVFVNSFIEWFGVLYGFLLPLVLVRVWEEFDKIDNTFDTEADTIKILVEDILLLHQEYKSFKLEVLRLLYQYVNHVNNFYRAEGDDKSTRRNGDRILQKIRGKYISLLHAENKDVKESDALISELLNNLNEIIDIRGDRLALSTKRLFESLKFIAIATSVVWVVPFYFIMQSGVGVFSRLLIICVIYLVVNILAIIEDLDNPFDGQWKIDQDSWEELLSELSPYK